MNRMLLYSGSLFFAVLTAAGCGRRSPETLPASGTQTEPADAAASFRLKVNDATALWKNGDYQQAVVKFHDLQVNTPMSGQQLMELNQAMAATMSDLYTRAAQGDARAKMAVAEYDRLKNRR